MNRLSMLCGLTLLTLTGCASNPSTSTPPLPLPTVTCSEHAPFEPLPAYPVAPADNSVASLSQYSHDQAVWAAQVAGIVQRDALLRNATAHCLDQLRKAGVIN